MKIFVVMPVYNEVVQVNETINSILARVDIPIVVVDDGSTDGSLKGVKMEFKTDTRVITTRHLINLGKGAAMKTGAKIAWKLGAEAVVFMDADGQHNPKYLAKFISELEKYPMVFGYRSLGKKSPWLRRTGNKFVGKLVKILFNVKRKDLMCGFLGLHKEVYRKVEWNDSRYGIETEMAIKVARNKIPFSEVKIDTIYLDKYKGMTIFDSLKILGKIPYWYLNK